MRPDNRTTLSCVGTQFDDETLRPMRHYLYGGFYPVGGSWRIADLIIPKIQRAGGEVFTYARVEGIAVEEDRVVGVDMAMHS